MTWRWIGTMKLTQFKTIIPVKNTISDDIAIYYYIIIAYLVLEIQLYDIVLQWIKKILFTFVLLM